MGPRCNGRERVVSEDGIDKAAYERCGYMAPGKKRRGRSVSEKWMSMAYGRQVYIGARYSEGDWSVSENGGGSMAYER